MADWPPLKGASLQIVTPLYDGSGSLVAAVGGLSACVSKDAGAFAAATCTVTEINANAGIYAMKLSATEMDADVVVYKIVSTSASARPSIGVLYTAASRQLKDLAWPATAGRSLAVDANGATDVRAIAASAIVASTLGANALHAAAVAASAIGASQFAAGAVDNAAFNVTENLNAAVVSIAASAIGASQFASGAVDNAAFSVTETLTAIPPASGLAASSFASGALDNNAWNVTEVINASVTAIAASAIGASQLAANSIHAAAVAASVLSASKFAANSLHAAAFAASTLSACKLAANTLDSTHIAASALAASKFGASFIELGYLTNAAASFVGTVVRTGCALAEQGVGIPPATPTLEQAISYQYMNWRNAASTTSGCIQITNDAGTVIALAAISDSASTFVKGEFQSG
jgi:hypothetical protein